MKVGEIERKGKRKKERKREDIYIYINSIYIAYFSQKFSWDVLQDIGMFSKRWDIFRTLFRTFFRDLCYM